MLSNRMALALIFVSGCSTGLLGISPPGERSRGDQETTDGDSSGSVTCEGLDDTWAPPAGNYYVSTRGDDANDGQTRATAFATVQKGVDALAPGDTLVIGPGEYFGPVRREGIGGAQADTAIRAEIPGTVILRGDVASPSFTPLAGYPFIYVADFDSPHEVQVINELDTLTVLERKPSISELGYAPGTFHHDAVAQKLYLSTTDRAPIEQHHYSLGVTPTHGLYLREAIRVVIDGIAATGFNAAHDLDHNERTGKAVFGIFLAYAQDSTIHNCHAYLNARGIGTWSDYEPWGGNVIEHSVARGNLSQYGHGISGGLTLFYPKSDEIRDSVSYLNGVYGANIRGQAEDGSLLDNQSFLTRIVAWGNGLADYRIKTGFSHEHSARRTVARGEYWGSTTPDHSMAGKPLSGAGPDTIVLSQESDLDLDSEFADPAHHDYRLQATSRFRGSMADGSDRGPYPYGENIFYVAPTGDDSNDGLAVEQAWQSLAHAADTLAPGDTLYLLPGTYSEDVSLSLSGTAAAPISIRGRGIAPAILSGEVRIADSAHVNLTRLHFSQPLRLERSDSLAVANSVFSGTPTGLFGANTSALKVTQSTFTGFATTAVSLPCSVGAHLGGNLYDNGGSVAVQLDSIETVRHSDHNSYRNATTAWRVGGDAWTLTEVRAHHDHYSMEQIPEISVNSGAVTLANPSDFAGGGTLGHPIGTYRYEPRTTDLRLVAGPSVDSVSASTANIQWFTSLPATVSFRWGSTQAMEQEVEYDASHFGSYSLTGLSPDTTYYFRLEALRIPDRLDDIRADPATVDTPILSFTTAATDAAPQTYYVANDGDNAHAGTVSAPWRTIQHAATRVNVGDTVVVQGGIYRESVRIHATGSPTAPITFRAQAGEKVLFDGTHMALHQGFVIGKKSHLRFDGFFFDDFNFTPSSSNYWMPALGSEFNIHDSHDIQLTRIFSDGRGSSRARTLVAKDVTELHLRNVVSINKMSSALFCWPCPDLLVEKSVFARPMITAFLLRNDSGQPSLWQDTIFTDNLKKKADANIQIFNADTGLNDMLMDNNLYMLRSFPVETREVFYPNKTIPDVQNSGHMVNPLVGDADFQGGLDLVAEGVGVGSFPPDRLMWTDIDLTFRHFFTTNAEAIARGIGLETDRFDENGLPN